MSPNASFGTTSSASAATTAAPPQIANTTRYPARLDAVSVTSCPADIASTTAKIALAKAPPMVLVVLVSPVATPV